MSINHLLNDPELDISVKSLNIGTYNVTPFNQVKTDPSEVVLYYNTLTASVSRDADIVRYHISRNGDFIDVTGYVGWDFPVDTLQTAQTMYFDIVIPHPEVDSAYTAFSSRLVAPVTTFLSRTEIGYRTTGSNLNDDLAVAVAGTTFNTTLRQRILVGVFTGTNNVLCSFKYSILCKTK